MDSLKSKKTHILILMLALIAQSLWGQVRIKDLARMQGLKQYQLIGYGIVVGLNGTGDSKRSQFTTQSVINMLTKFGVTVPSNKVKLRNVAAVIVTSEVPAYARKGDRVDVLVSSLGDAKTLEGGVLLMTPLVLQDGKVAAMAQGPMTVGGFSVETSDGGGVRQNHTLVGIIPQGGILENDMGGQFNFSGNLFFSLKNKDITTTQKTITEINRAFGPNTARAFNLYTIEVVIPESYQQAGLQHAFLAELEQLEVNPDVPSRIVINERTGTIVIGGKVSVLPAAIAHGNLSVEIRSEPIVSQPAPFSMGQTTVVPNTKATVYQDSGRVIHIDKATTVQEVAAALNAIGIVPRDIIAVLQALRVVGALQAELVVM